MRPRAAQAPAMSDTSNDGEADVGSPPSAGGQFFDTVGSVFRGLGFDTAADNLARYRSGVGGTHVYSNAEIARHGPLLRYEDQNRSMFESFSFVGENDRGNPTGVLQNIRDGEMVNYHDNFLSSGTPHWPSTYLAFGRTGVLSKLTGTARRDGDNIFIDGEVTHDFNGGNNQGGELFDFNPGQPGRRSATEAEAAGEARPFTMHMDRRQTVSALARYEPNGLLTLQRVDWGAVR
jgi:hypothetical protein